MNVNDFDYELPRELIAQDPLEDRASSRLLLLHKDSGEIEHHIFREIPSLLRAGDCLVINNTKVIPARLIGSREGTGAAIVRRGRKHNQSIAAVGQQIRKAGTL